MFHFRLCVEHKAAINAYENNGRTYHHFTRTVLTSNAKETHMPDDSCMHAEAGNSNHSREGVSEQQAKTVSFLIVTARQSFSITTTTAENVMVKKIHLKKQAKKERTSNHTWPTQLRGVS